MPGSRHPSAPFTSPDHWRPVLALCRQAAGIILRHYADAELAVRLRSKDDDSPLTRADLASHALLRDGLAALEPRLPLLSEESDAAAIAERRQWSRFWMVDPLDGTREFLERTGEFSINVALIDGQRPLAGLIYEPMNGAASLGIVGVGAWRCRPAGDDWTLDALHTRGLCGGAMVVLASRRHRNPRLASTLDFLGDTHRIERRDSGSALKFADLARGDGDVYPRFSPCSEWDVAAGDALVTAAGGAVIGLDGEPLRYNARESLLNPPFLAVGDPASTLWPALLAHLRSSGQAGA